MALTPINVGTAPNDGTGDTLKTSFTKCNAMFAELYSKPPGNAYTASGTAPSSPNAGDFWYDTSTGILSIYVNDGNSSQWVQTSPGSTSAPGGFINVQKFTTAGTATYIPTAGTQFVVVECVGGGAGGGGAYNPGGYYVSSGGGGSGGYSRRTLPASALGASQTITVGAAGAGGSAGSVNGSPGATTSFGAFCVANGGIGGLYSDSPQGGVGGAGAAVGTGDIAAGGAPGETGGFHASVNTAEIGGGGGSSIFGGGGRPGYNNGGALAGQPALSYGSGGAGGSIAAINASTTGGAGSAGIVIVTEYSMQGPPGAVGPQGGTTGVAPPQGRLTLQAATPVMTTSSTGISAIRYTQYVGDKIPIYDGTVWTMTTFTELTNVTTDSVTNKGGPAAVAANSIYDLFVWNDAGTIRLTRGPAWTNDTTRAQAITRVNGMWVNFGAITNGPAGNRGTYVGTARSNAANTWDWAIGGKGPGGVPALLGVWNCYNRVDVAAWVADSTVNWSYAAAAWRAAANSGGMRVWFLLGLSEDPVDASYGLAFFGTSTMIGIGLDTTATFAAGCVTAWGSNGGNALTYTSLYKGTPSIGFHYLSAIEFAYTGTSSFYGTVDPPSHQSGFLATIRM